MQRSLAAALAVAGLALLVAVPAPAAPNSTYPVSGAFVPTDQIVSGRLADGNVVVVDETAYHRVTGSLAGTSVLHVHFVLHAAGFITFEGSSTFTGTTPCGVGTFHFRTEGSGPLTGPIGGTVQTIDEGDASLSMHATLAISLFLTPEQNAMVTYTGEVRCG